MKASRKPLAPGRAILTAAALSLLAVGCSSNDRRAAPAPSTTTSTVENSQFIGCSPRPIFAGQTQKGRSNLILVFRPGTTAEELDAVANRLQVGDSRQAVLDAIATGVSGVTLPSCNPPQIVVLYRTSMSAKDLAKLRARLLTEPGVIEVREG